MVAYAHGGPDQFIDEVVATFADWTYAMVPALVEQGFITPGLAVLLDRLFAASMTALEADTTSRCQEAVTRPQWDEVRVVAKAALQAFADLEVTVPPLDQRLFGDVALVPAGEREHSDVEG
jgi:hypothetical protein